MKNCRDCQHQVSKSATACPQCGAHLQSLGRVDYAIDRIVLVVCVLGVGLAVLVWFVL